MSTQILNVESLHATRYSDRYELQCAWVLRYAEKIALYHGFKTISPRRKVQIMRDFLAWARPDIGAECAADLILINGFNNIHAKWSNVKLLMYEKFCAHTGALLSHGTDYSHSRGSGYREFHSIRVVSID